MTAPSDPLERVDQALLPVLPHIGAIAVDSARLEWGLSGLVSMLTNEPPEDAIRMKTDSQVRAIKRALRDVTGTDRQWADAITYWATTAKGLLFERGNLMHSHWIVGDTPSPDDLVSTGQLTAEQAQDVDPQDFVNVYSRRLRGTDPPVRRAVPDLAEFARSLHEHMANYPPMWFAAGIVIGIWPVPDGTQAPTR